MTTAEDIYRALEKRQGDRGGFRRWLGASMIGHACKRFVALSFRCAFHSAFKGQTLRIFENGHRAEDRIVEDLEASGKIRVLSRQHTVDMPGGMGHAGVTLDGVAFEDGGYNVLEMKTMHAKGWKELSEKGVMQAKRQHYCQMQFGMELTGLPGALYVAENKDTNELYLEYVRYNGAVAEALLALARAVIAGKELPRCSERPDWYECKWCPAYGVCHGDAFPRAHCLTCCHASPAEGGRWRCGKWDAEIPDAELPKGCADHVYVPWMVHLPVEGWGEYWVTYRLPGGGRLCNCTAGSFPSIDAGATPVIATSAEMEQKKFVSALLRECAS